MLVIMAAKKVSDGSDNQFTASIPSFPNNIFIAPNLKLNIPFQVRADIYWGIAQGIISNILNHFLPGNFLLRVTASNKPILTWKNTFIKVQNIVLIRVATNLGSLKNTKVVFESYYTGMLKCLEAHVCNRQVKTIK